MSVLPVKGPAALLWLLLGFTVWSAAFLGLYILHALGCEWGWQAREVGGISLLRLVLLATWALHLGLAVLVAMAARRLRSETTFLLSTAFALAVAAVAATAWSGLPVLALPLCA